MRNPQVLIIGAGMTGILAAIRLQQQGIDDFVILEKKDQLGGTWRENTYPGVACDVPSHMYTYSFEPNPNWSNFFARGSEIKDYFETVADKYQLRNKIRFNEAVTEAEYKNSRWEIKSSQGKNYKADFIIGATGILHHPAKPDIKGLDKFKGKVFHSAEWDHSTPFNASQKVGVIGTGSTAAQFIPELVKSGAEVKVFQRTPQWLLPIADFKIPQFIKTLLNKSPTLLKMSRAMSIFTLEHLFTKAVTGHKPQQFILSSLCKLNLRLSIKDQQLRDKLRPSYQVGCKRVIINKTFYKAIQQDNAELITSGIEEITETGLITSDGVEHKLDTLVLSTGFKPFNFMRPMNLIGENALHIDQAWDKKVKAYRSILLDGFPNFFLMLGPNTPIGNFSVIAMSEVQMDYISQLIQQWREHKFDNVAARPEEIERFNQYIKDGLAGTSWVGGCQSWYLDPDGTPVLWPYTWKRWVDEMATPNLDELKLG